VEGGKWLKRGVALLGLVVSFSERNRPTKSLGFAIEDIMEAETLLELPKCQKDGTKAQRSPVARLLHK
jgi:hypothetical protein